MGLGSRGRSAASVHGKDAAVNVHPWSVSRLVFCLSVFCLAVEGAGGSVGVGPRASGRAAALESQTKTKTMKLTIIAAIAAAGSLAAVSCCPSSAPAPSKPVYQAPSK